MYAVVKTGGKQLTVKKGDTIKVEKLEGNAGDSVELTEVLSVGEGENLSIGTPTVENAKVVCEITNQLKAKKIIVFKKKRRQGYKLKQGHRQNLTELTVKEIIA